MFYYPYENSFVQRFTGTVTDAQTVKYMTEELHLPERLCHFCIEAGEIIKTDLQNMQNQTVYYFCPTEPVPFLTPDAVMQIDKICRQNNNHFYVVHSNLFDDLVEHYEPTTHVHFINNILLNIGRAYNESLQYIKQDIDYNFDRAFINLNNKGRYNRYLLVDEIYKQGIQNAGYISWQSRQDATDPFDFDIDHKLKYFHGNKLSLDNNINYLDEKINASGLVNICTEYYEYFFDVRNISEKTMYALMTEKPFVVLGAQHNNTVYSDYGFELYTELFDYRFDANEDLQYRAKGIVDNLKLLVGKDYNKLYSSVKEKANHNKQQFIKLIQKELNDNVDDVILDIMRKDSDHPDMILHQGYYNGLVQILEN